LAFIFEIYPNPKKFMLIRSQGYSKPQINRATNATKSLAVPLMYSVGHNSNLSLKNLFVKLIPDVVIVVHVQEDALCKSIQ
jgi:hypothetical protein